MGIRLVSSSEKLLGEREKSKGRKTYRSKIAFKKLPEDILSDHDGLIGRQPVDRECLGSRREIGIRIEISKVQAAINVKALTTTFMTMPAM